MNRGYWASVMVFGLIVTSAAAYYLYSELSGRAFAAVPLSDMAPTRPPATGTDLDGGAEGGEPAAEEATEPILLDETDTPAPTDLLAPDDGDHNNDQDPHVDPGAPRNILFTFHSTTARSVTIIGQFNDWMRQPLQRGSGGAWTTSILIPPGRYEYLYNVDGRRTPDPNNPQRAADGKSILIVKPLHESD